MDTLGKLFGEDGVALVLLLGFRAGFFLVIGYFPDNLRLFRLDKLDELQELLLRSLPEVVEYRVRTETLRDGVAPEI